MTEVAYSEALNQIYLAAEIQQVDVLVRALLQTAIKSGRTADRFQGLYISPDTAQRFIEAAQPNDPPIEPSSAPTASPDFEAEFQNALAESRQTEQTAAQSAEQLRLLHLRETFGLSEFEYRAFILCLLPALDLRYAQIYAFLQDDVTQKQAGANLIIDLLGKASDGFTRLQPLACFGATGALVQYRLIRPVNHPAAWLEPRLDQHFEVPPAVVAWLLGDYFPEEEWLKLYSTSNLQGELDGSPFARQFELDWEKIGEHRPLLSFYGPDEERRRQAAQKVACYFSRHLLEVDLREACGEAPFSPSMLRLLIRDACLLDAVTYIQGWEKALDEHGFISPSLLEEMAEFGGLFILGSHDEWRISGKGGRPVFQVHFEQPSGAERFALWQDSLSDSIPVSPEALRNVSGQFTLTSGQIDNAVFTVLNRAFQSDQAITDEDLYQAARQQSSHHLGKLAQKIQPRYSWPDIILPSEELELLRDLVSTVRNRALVLEEWGLGKKLTSSAGVAALFTGEPGTGKTLAAQVLAAELQLDIYRIDLSTVVSKYIGETEKNLEKIFSEAQHSNAILFFDEADTIFGKRSEVKDAHDRYANIEVGYLLQRLEAYDGVTILATNLRTNIDEAFTRRLQFIINFPFPDEEQRLAIWQILRPAALPLDAGVDWSCMAHRYPIAGGNIRNILVAAAFMAAQDGRVLTMDHLMKATRREMQKMGRFIKDDDYLCG